MQETRRIFRLAMYLFILIAFVGCAGAPLKPLDTSTGKPEIVVNASKKAIAEYLIDQMLSKGCMIKSQSENVLVLYKSTTYTTSSLLNPQEIPAEIRVTFNFVTVPDGVRVMTDISGIKYPNTTYEQVVQNVSGAEEAAHSLQIVLNDMKFDLEDKNPGKSGALISMADGKTILGIEKNSPAEKAGLQVGDIIMSIDGVATTDDELENFKLRNKEAGTTHQFFISRKGKTQTIAIEYVKRNVVGRASSASSATKNKSIPANAMLNIESIGAIISGGKIISVVANGPADKAGVHKGDIITMIDGNPASANGVENAKRLVGKTNTSVVVTLKRGEQELMLPIIRKNP